jgi:hypothetical protein
MPLSRSSRAGRGFRRAAVALALLGALSVRGEAQERSTVGAGRVSAQIAAGTLATPVSFVVGGLGSRWVARTLGADEGAARTTATSAGGPARCSGQPPCRP